MCILFSAPSICDNTVSGQNMVCRNQSTTRLHGDGARKPPLGLFLCLASRFPRLGCSVQHTPPSRLSWSPHAPFSTPWPHAAATPRPVSTLFLFPLVSDPGKSFVKFRFNFQIGESDVF